MRMKMKIVLFSIATLFCFGYNGAWGQGRDTLYRPEVYYTAPKIYEIASVKVEGISGRYDENTIIELAGLFVGQVLEIPGEKLTNSLKKLLRQGLFSNITYSLDKVVGDKAYLTIHLTEGNKLSAIRYTGAKKSEINKIKEKYDPQAGTQVSEYLISNLKRVIQQYYKEKGYYNMDVRVVQRDDPESKGFVILDVEISKKNKIKISEIVIEGNREVSDTRLKGAMKKTKEKSLRTFLKFKSAKYIESNYEEDKYNLLDKYNELGYRDAVILSDTVIQINPQRVKILLNVNEGNKYYFNKISWVGNTVYSSDMLSGLLNIRKGAVYNKKYFEKRLNGDDDAVRNYFYLNNGYLFCRMNPVETVVGSDSINIEIRMMEGRQATINRVNIAGNTRTHEHVIRRELYTYPGDLFSMENYKRSLQQIAALGNFDEESLMKAANEGIQPNYNDGTVDIGYKLTEKGNDRIELSGGWGAGMFIGSLALTFNNFSVRNIFNAEAYRPLPEGDGQKLALRAQTNGKYYSQYSISFSEPWLGGRRPNAFSFSAYYSRQTGYSDRYRRNAFGYYDRGYNPYYLNYSDIYDENSVFSVFGLSVGLGRRIKWPDDYFMMQNELSFQHYYLNNWKYNNFGFGFQTGTSNSFTITTVLRRSSIDLPIYTRNGSDFTLSVALTPPYSLFSNADFKNETPQDKYRWVEYHKWKFNGKIYMPLDRMQKLVLYTNIQFGYLGHYRSERRSPFEGFEMGGTGISGYSMYGTDYIGLRGYADGTITNRGSFYKVTDMAALASKQATVYEKFTMELRYPIVLQEQTKIYGFGFIEGGNSWYRLKDFDPLKMFRSAGVGVRIFLPMFGLLGFDWGYGFDTVSGFDNQKRSNFHFVLGQEF